MTNSEGMRLVEGDQVKSIYGDTNTFVVEHTTGNVAIVTNPRTNDTHELIFADLEKIS